MAQTKDKQAQNGKVSWLATRSRKLLMAGLGAGMLVQDELSDLAERLIDRGEIAEKKGRERIDKLITESQKQCKQASKRFEDDLEDRMEDVLHRLNMPTRTEIKSLNAKIARLNRKVNELKKASA